MSLEPPKAKEASPTVLRLAPELKAELTKMAALNNRSLSNEISTRLKISLGGRGPTFQGILSREAESKGMISNPLPASYTAAPTPVVHHTNDNGPASALTDIDRAMLTVFHQLPPEKQLALLSLFR